MSRLALSVRVTFCPPRHVTFAGGLTGPPWEADRSALFRRPERDTWLFRSHNLQQHTPTCMWPSVKNNSSQPILISLQLGNIHNAPLSLSLLVDLYSCEKPMWMLAEQYQGFPGNYESARNDSERLRWRHSYDEESDTCWPRHNRNKRTPVLRGNPRWVKIKMNWQRHAGVHSFIQWHTP